MVKKLLAVGCSYTEDVYPFPVWPKLLAEKFNMECINLGQCGSGNEYIYSRTLDALVTEKNLGLVVVMWSQFQRLDFYDDDKWKCFGSSNLKAFFQAGNKERNRKECTNKLEMLYNKIYDYFGYDDISHHTGRSIRLFYSLQQIMKLPEYNNIPFYQLMGTYPCDRTQKYIAAKTIIDSPYLDKINEMLFLGWPIFDELGGWNVDTWLDKVDLGKRNQDSDVRISQTDCHPNKKGHEKIAEMLYNEIKKGVLNGSIQTT